MLYLRLPLALLPAAVLLSTAQAQISNQDNCSNSGTDNVGPGVYNYDNSGATTGTQGQNEASCYKFATTGIDNDIWFTYTAASSNQAVINTCGTACDTKIAAWPSTAACPTDGTSLDCNDDTCGLQSQVSFPATSGTSYIIQVGNFPGVAGCAGTISIAEQMPLANDECTTAVSINMAGQYNFDTTGATTSFAWPCGAGGSDIWYRFTAPNTASYVFDTCNGTGYDSTLEIFGGTCNALASLACNDDACGLQSQVVLSNAVQGTDYYLRIGGFGSATGTGILTVTEQVPGTLLTNQDSCANASMDSIGAGLYDWDNSGATTGPEGQNEALCYAFGTSGIESDIWAVYNVGVNGSVTIESCGAIGSLADTRIAAYPLAPCASIDGTSVACSDDDCGAGFLSSITFNVSCGQSYLVQLGSFPGGGTGSSQMRITESGGSCGPGPIGTTPANCNPAVANSTGLPAEISAFGSVQVSNMDVSLSATHVPSGQFGIFFTSQTLGMIPNPGGSLGNICVIGNQGRYNMVSQIYVGGGGGVSVPAGGLQVGNIPVPVNPTIPAFTSGTWYFQGWFREIGGLNNFTNVVEINFVP